MTTIEFLSELRKLGAELQADGDRLRVNAPKNVLTPALKEQLVAHKEEILTFLKAAKTEFHTSVSPIQPVSREAPLPLSFAQQRLWFLEQLETNSPYNMPYAQRFTGPLNMVVLEQSLTEVVRRHEVLRTVIKIIDGQPVQVICPPEPFTIRQLDLRAFPEPERDAEIRRLINEETQHRFNLAQELPLRAVLLHLAQNDCIFILNMHHIVSDMWSMGVLAREVISLYQTFSLGQPSPLPELPIQYADFAHWQRQWFQGEIFETQLAYWKKQLSGDLPVLQLPIARPRPDIQTFRGCKLSFTLPQVLTEALKALSLQEEGTLFMTLLAAFKTLIYRYSGQIDILIGSPIVNRHWAETEVLIGFFLNTLVFRTDLSGNPTFRELLRRVRTTAIDAYAHQDLPFEKLVDELQPKRTLNHNPLFQVMFTLENVPVAKPIPLPGVTYTPLDLDTGTAKFDLTLFTKDTGTNLVGIIEYNTDLFDEDTISRMIGHLQVLLTAIVANPDLRLSELPLLTDIEQQQLLLTWNNTRAEYPAQTIPQLFEVQAARTPNAIALVYEGVSLTYGELNQRANQLAHYLTSLGGGPETLVGICIQRSLDMVVGLLGILKAGMAYVPLDPAYPKDRLTYMLSDSQAPLLLTQQELAEELPPSQAKIICLDTDWPSISRESVENLDSRVTGDNLAYAIYTSGSTGAPKGVLGLHRGTINRFQWMWRTYPFTEGEVACQKTALSFVDSIWEIFGPLLQGVKLIVIPDAIVKDPARLVETLAAEQVSRIVLVPSLLTAILDTHPTLADNLPQLTTWVCSGEALSFDLSQRFHRQMAHSRLINLYGSSEVAADSTYYETRVTEPYPVIPIGRPIDNTTVYLLDAHLQPVPLGVPGDIYIGGDGLARGYLHRPELTQERFISNPFQPSPETCYLYKTGDLGRYLPDGNIEYLGRLDHQVKIRGMRIELGEIEAALRRHTAVQQVVVIAREDQPGDKRLVAYIVPHSDQSLAASELRESLKKILPDYMLPAVYVFMEALPLTPNKKVDRRALPPPELTHFTPTPDFVAPRNIMEVQLVQIWRELLGVGSIGVTDSFFDRGGHSLLVVRLFAEIEKRFNKRLPITTLFQSPTIASLAEILQKEGCQPSWSSLIAIQPGGSKPPFYCVHEVDGNAFYYRDLARYLGTDQPFYGLQAQGLDGKSKPHTSIEAMAAHYIKEIQEFQPHGPYYLGGSSLGGLVAFEMARQLHEQGKEVGLLVFFDTWSIGYLRLVSLPLRYRVKRHMGGLVQQRARTWMVDRIQRAKSRLNLSNLFKNNVGEANWRLARLLCKIYQRLGISLPPPLLDVHIRSSLIEAQSNYIPKPYCGQAVFFLSSEQPTRYYHDPRLDLVSMAAAEFFVGEATDPVWQECAKLGWGSLVQGGLEIHEVNGPHAFMVREPHAKELAQKLAACLNSVQGKADLVLGHV